MSTRFFIQIYPKIVFGLFPILWVEKAIYCQDFFIILSFEQAIFSVQIN